MAENIELYLAPYPKRLTRRDGVFNIQGKKFIRLDGDPQLLLPAAVKSGFDWEVTASPKAPKNETGLVIKLDKSADIPGQGYKLTIKPQGIEIVASTPAGAFYGACTLSQIMLQSDENLPCLSITDSPDFPSRGIMLDVSRDKVPTMETLFHLVDLMADWKLNELQLYTEHTFEYLAHPTVWEKASPMTGEEILALNAYCRSQFIELVPNQNSFGHMTRWLIHDEYRGMAEAPNGCDTIWGYFKDPFSLCPLDKRCVPFLDGLYTELLPHFSSKMFNVGCDETVDLGRGRSEKAVKERGVGRVYLDFLLQIHELCQKHGHTMQFWGDIIMHHPELIPELPKDIIALEWGYEANHPFAEHGKMFADSGVPFYVCPGTSSWNNLSGRTENGVANIASAAKNGLKYGAIGFLNTDWGDNGHWQPLPVSYTGYLAGAMASWNAKYDFDKTLTQNLSLHAYGDSTFKSGKAFYNVGNVHLAFKRRDFNSTVQWHLLFDKLDDPNTMKDIKPEELDEVERRLKAVREEFEGEEMASEDASIVREELDQVIKMVEAAISAARMRLGNKPDNFEKQIMELKTNHARVWLLRNRPGGLPDSIDRLNIG